MVPRPLPMLRLPPLCGCRLLAGARPSAAAATPLRPMAPEKHATLVALPQNANGVPSSSPALARQRLGNGPKNSINPARVVARSHPSVSVIQRCSSRRKEAHSFSAHASGNHSIPCHCPWLIRKIKPAPVRRLQILRRIRPFRPFRPFGPLGQSARIPCIPSNLWLDRLPSACPISAAWFLSHRDTR